MKIKNLLLVVTLFISASFFAQRKDGDKRSQIKALKVAYITTELSLTTDEASKFWPIFNTFEDKQRAIRKENMLLFKNKSQAENLSEREASNLITEMESLETELYELKKKFISNLKDILPAVKIIKLKQAEDDFSRKLLQQYRSRK
jgi:Spy/CpxP family protein refolding chaperone